MKDTNTDFRSLLSIISEEAEGITEASNKFKKSLLENPSLLRAWASDTDTITEWAEDQIRMQYRRDRKPMYYSLNYDKGGNQEAARDRVNNFRLPSGVRVMEATIEQLIEASEFYVAQGKTMIEIGKRYKKLADLVKKRRKKIVRNACSDEEISKIFNLEK